MGEHTIIFLTSYLFIVTVAVCYLVVKLLGLIGVEFKWNKVITELITIVFVIFIVVSSAVIAEHFILPMLWK